MDINIYAHLAAFLLNLSFLFFFFLICNKVIMLSNNPVMPISVTSSIAIILCMIFSISPTEGYVFDLRSVPFIIGALYGGRKVSFALLVVLLSFRFYIGGDGLLPAFIHYGLVYIPLWYAIPMFKASENIRKRIFIGVITSVIYSIFYIVIFLFFHLNFGSLQLLSLIILHIMPILGVSSIIKIIEDSRKNNLLMSEVKKLEKLKSISEIAASISHEVRNPLTVTNGFLQLLKDKEIPYEKRIQYIDLSLEELKKAENVITDYLTFAKPSFENLEIIQLNNEINYVIKVLNPYALMNNVEIKFEGLATAYVTCEKQKLHQVLINLVKNGIEAMPEGGELEIRLEEENEQAVIVIRDQGVGMNKEQIERLGMPYYTTKGVKGTGLGTMVVYSIIKAMRGKIIVDSVVDKGTCFTITLPKINPI